MERPMEIRMPPPKTMNLADRLNMQQCPLPTCDRPEKDREFSMLTQGDERCADLRFCFPECAARANDQGKEITTALGAEKVRFYYLLGNGQCACEYVPQQEEAIKSAA